MCWTFDGRTYEGMRTRVRMRYGLVRGMCRVPGFEAAVERGRRDRRGGPGAGGRSPNRFLELGGYDPIYFPGRIEDLDLGFRGWMAGYRGYYVPDSVAYHWGFGTFASELGMDRSQQLASRNTLIYMWKNTSGASAAGRTCSGCRFASGPRVARPSGLRPRLFSALRRVDRILAARRKLAVGGSAWTQRQEAFYRRFSW